MKNSNGYSLKSLILSIAIVTVSQSVMAMYKGLPLPKELLGTSTVISFEDAKYDCSYVIIHEKFLLTAAHCADYLSKGQPLRSRNSDKSASGKHTIEDIIIHDGHVRDFDKNPDIEKGLALIKNDIALVKLSAPIKDYPIRPAPLVKSEDGEFPLSVLVVGNGHTENRTTGVSQALNGKMSSYAYRNAKKEVVQLPIFNIDSSGPGVCSGDSGGGVFVRQNDQWELIGILSTKTGTQACAKENTEVFAVPVLDNLEWILSNLQK